MKKYIYLVLFFYFCFPKLYSQQDSLESDSYTLKEIEVFTDRLHDFSSGSKILSIDKKILEENQSGNLSNVLAQHSPLFIKNYSISGLSTPSFRGSGAGHTAILWNGINIQSPTNGLIDFKLIPISFIDQLTLQYGGSSSLWGSGAIGGSIHLNNSAVFNQGFTANASVSLGSFDNKQENIGLGYSNDKISISGKAFFKNAKNDFNFENTAQLGSPEQTISNAETRQNGLILNNYFKINKNQIVNLHAWYQYNDRNLPPSMTINQSKSNQKDKSFRSIAEWKIKKTKESYSLRIAYFNEELLYTDSLISLESKNNFQTLIAETEAKFEIGKNQFLNLGINNTYNSALTKNYLGLKDRNRTALFVSHHLQLFSRVIKITSSFRQEFIFNGDGPFTFSEGVETWLMKTFRFRGNISKNYRIPNLNDLFWTPGGNPDLLSENSWNYESAIAFIKCIDNFSLDAEITAFSNNVTNWIIWLPNNMSVWSPQNILNVWARGLEYDLSISKKINKFKIDVSGQYNFVRSTNEKTESANNAALHKQLIYVPSQKAMGNIRLTYKGYSLAFIYNYIGYRYTTSDNKSYLNPYQLVDIYFNKSFFIQNYTAQLFLQANNILNESYQAIAYYAMPGASYLAGISISFNQKNKQQ